MARTTGNTRAVTFERTNLDEILGSVESASVVARKQEVEARRATKFSLELDREMIEQAVVWFSHAIKLFGIKPDTAESQVAYLVYVAEMTAKGKDIQDYTLWRVNFGAKAAYKVAIVDKNVPLAELERDTAVDTLEGFIEAIKSATPVAKTKK